MRAASFKVCRDEIPHQNIPGRCNHGSNSSMGRRMADWFRKHFGGLTWKRERHTERESQLQHSPVLGSGLQSDLQSLHLEVSMQFQECSMGRIVDTKTGKVCLIVNLTEMSLEDGAKYMAMTLRALNGEKVQ